MTQRRYTITTLKAGQQRPYGSTVYTHQIMYEWQGMAGYKDKNAPFVLNDHNSEEGVRRDAKHIFGWAEKEEGGWWSTRLVYLKKVSPGVWEWETRAEYDD